MAHYYLSIEVYGKGERPDPLTDRILLAITCPIDPSTGKALCAPTLLRAWEIGEAEVTKNLVRRFFGSRAFDAIPVGFNLAFSLWFIKHKAREHLKLDLGDAVFTEKPALDIKPALVIANRGVFKGVAIGDGGVREWYENVDLARIERHAREKFLRFQAEYARLAKRLR